MKIKFWGVRGSIPSPGPGTVRYGGNTPCISVDLNSDKILVLDAGTGMRKLGEQLLADETDIYILLTHNHWDHMQGFPFFGPLYQPGRNVYVFKTPHEKRRLCALVDQMDGAHFPIRAEDLPSRYTCIEENVLNFLSAHGFHISQVEANHPGGAYGYRIEAGGHSLVYLTDNELEPPYPKATDFEGFVRFCRGTDMLIHDAQFTEEDMPQKHGWGHSLVTQACDLAISAGVKHLVLFHHDPDRSDEDLDAIQEQALQQLDDAGTDSECTVAFEGFEVDLAAT